MIKMKMLTSDQKVIQLEKRIKELETGIKKAMEKYWTADGTASEDGYYAMKILSKALHSNYEGSY